MVLVKFTMGQQNQNVLKLKQVNEDLKVIYGCFFSLCQKSKYCHMYVLKHWSHKNYMNYLLGKGVT